MWQLMWLISTKQIPFYCWSNLQMLKLCQRVYFCEVAEFGAGIPIGCYHDRSEGRLWVFPPKKKKSIDRKVLHHRLSRTLLFFSLGMGAPQKILLQDLIFPMFSLDIFFDFPLGCPNFWWMNSWGCLKKKKTGHLLQNPLISQLYISR